MVDRLFNVVVLIFYRFSFIIESSAHYFVHAVLQMHNYYFRPVSSYPSSNYSSTYTIIFQFSFSIYESYILVQSATGVPVHCSAVWLYPHPSPPATYLLSPTSSFCFGAIAVHYSSSQKQHTMEGQGRVTTGSCRLRVGPPHSDPHVPSRRPQPLTTISQFKICVRLKTYQPTNYQEYSLTN